MRKITSIFAIIVILAMLLAACGTPATEEAAAPEEVATEVVATEEPAPTEDTGEAIVAEEATATPVPVVEEIAYTEAPTLAEKVAAGELPAVEERLPADPGCHHARISRRQVRWHLATASWWPKLATSSSTSRSKPPLKWKADLTGYEPGLVESYEWSEDGMTFTMHLREGFEVVRWRALHDGRLALLVGRLCQERRL